MSGQDRNGEGKTQEHKLFVGGIHGDTEKEDMLAYFSKFGDIDDCVVMTDPVTKRSRGFGFVTFTTSDEVKACLSAPQHTLKGKTVEVKRAIPRGESAHKPPSSQQIPTKKVFLGGLAPDTDEHDIRDVMSQFGRVTDVIIMTDKDSKKPRGFGFAIFEEFDEVDKVCEERFRRIKDRDVEVKKAIPQEDMKRGDGGRSRGPAGNRGDYGGGYGREPYGGSYPRRMGGGYEGGYQAGSGYDYRNSYYMRPEYMSAGGGGGGGYSMATPGGAGGYGMPAAAMSGYGDARGGAEGYSHYSTYRPHQPSGYDMQSYTSMYGGGVMGSYGNQGPSNYGPSPRGYGSAGGMAGGGGSGQDGSRDMKDRGAGRSGYHPYRR